MKDFNESEYQKFIEEFNRIAKEQGYGHEKQHDDEDYGDVNDYKSYDEIEVEQAIDVVMNHVEKYYNRSLQMGLTQQQAFELSKIAFTSILYR